MIVSLPNGGSDLDSSVDVDGADLGELTQYYISPRASSEKKEKEKKNKKKLKLLKRLSTDLQMFASEDGRGIIISASV
ncbi:hypothetical protein LINPERHAP2_LOCUS840 [Linum perenne]